jgi:outer membrane receptor protein involved in Fe transport
MYNKLFFSNKRRNIMKVKIFSKAAVRIILSLTLFFTVSELYAASGKIAGTVIDKASGDPLPGANVLIEGLSLGAATDTEGQFFILNVPPGIYSVRVEMIGYKAVVQRDVRISIDLTTTINFETETEAIAGEEVVIVAEQPIIQPDISGSQRVVDVVELQAAPFQSIANLVTNQVSIDNVGAYEDRPEIRGNSIDNSLFIVDGVSQSDMVSNRPRYSVNLDAIQEVSLQTGGFSARYGNLRSGIVNVITKEGGQRISASANVQYSPPGLKHFGPSIFGHDSPVAAPFADPEQGAWTGYLMNPDGSFKLDENGQQIPSLVYQSFKGWNNYDEAGPHQGKPNELYARWLWRHRSQDSLEKLKELENQGLVQFSPDFDPDDPNNAMADTGIDPDYKMGFTLGGPVPLLNNIKRTTFFLSADREQMEYAIAFPQESFVDIQYRGKITSMLSDNIKLQIHGSWSRQKGSDGGEGPEITSFVSNAPYQTPGTNKLWYPDCQWGGLRTTQRYGVNWTHTLSASTFYELKLTYTNTEQGMIEHMRDTSPNPGVNLSLFPGGLNTSTGAGGVINGLIGTEAYADSMAAAGALGWENWRRWAKIKIGDQWYDETPDGWDPLQARDITGEYRFGSCGHRIDETTSKIFTVNGDLTSQVNRFNLVEAGFEAQFEDLNLYYRRIGAAGGSGWARIAYANQLKGAFYVTDKLEFPGFIANIGLRADFRSTGDYPYLNPDLVNDKVSGPYSDFLQGGQTLDEGEVPPNFKTYDVIPNKSKTDIYLSPRLGISHPITSVAKIFFNYGIMYQWPNPHDNYYIDYDIQQSWRVTRFGNLDLKPPRTIQYEIGYEHNLFNKINMRITSYYQDIYDQFGTATYRPLNFGSYDVPTNDQFADTRGIEIMAELRRGAIPYFSGWASFNYVSSSEGRYGISNFYEDPLQDPQEVSGEVSDPDVRPIVRLNADFHTPRRMGPEFAGINPLGGINMSLLYNWRRGAQFTYNPANIPLVENNLRWKPYQRWDLRLTKDLFTSGSFRSVFYIDIRNLFNNKNMSRNVGENDVNTSTNWAWDGHKWWKNQFQLYMESLGYLEDNQNKDGSFNNTTGTPGDNKGQLPGFTPWTFLEKRDIFFGVKLYF